MHRSAHSYTQSNGNRCEHTLYEAPAKIKAYIILVHTSPYVWVERVWIMNIGEMILHGVKLIGVYTTRDLEGPHF